MSALAPFPPISSDWPGACQSHSVGPFLDGRIRESLVLRRSAGFQTGLERAGGLVDLQPEHTLSRFGNRRSAKDSRMRPSWTSSDMQIERLQIWCRGAIKRGHICAVKSAIMQPHGFLVCLGGALARRMSGRLRPSRVAGERPSWHRSSTVVVPWFQGSFKLVSSLFEASHFFLPPGSRAGHRCGPAAEQRGVPRCPAMRYRLRKGWRGYRSLTSFKPATCT